ncbi:MAG TPA: S-methyl-5-thioribose-1-phosphate isomerase [Gammaproteobacteria bacterium]|nr:S-methyl-5-thioribose-1-phosphate isomerase [Gammaproteobacteria bacterium]
MDKQPMPLRPLYWDNNHLKLLDQRNLPGQEIWLQLDSAAGVADAIRSMAVRGAPAIGIAAAYGAALAAFQQQQTKSDKWLAGWQKDLNALAAARPTAVNLAWALDRMRCKASENATPQALLEEAHAIQAEDQRMNEQLSAHGASLIEPGSTVFTHCNTGALAASNPGTALGVIRTAFAQGKIEQVFATETRPWLQGARLTAWELAREGIAVTLLVDSAAAQAMAKAMTREKPVWLIAGADRIAANGDVANKIGTYGLALLAKHHGARVMVAAPSSTLDDSLANGQQIPIEDRGPGDIWQAEWGDIPPGLQIENPAFDVTQAELIDVIVTERGIRTD